MFASLARTLFGNANDRSLKGYQRRVPEINALEPAMQALDDAALRAKTAEFRQRLADGATLDDILPEAFATVREGAVRVLGMRHFDVQLIGGMVLNDGKIAEMKTGEGKTLVATLPVYLNALPAKGVHVVTVNDYLARRDAEWMGQLYGFLGLSTGIIVHGLDDEQRRAAYAADITYGTNNEFGFDYLRDNMKYTAGRHGTSAISTTASWMRWIQHPDRRGPHAADHLRPGGRQFLRPVSIQVDVVVRELVGDPEDAYDKDEKLQERDADRAWLGTGGGVATRGRRSEAKATSTTCHQHHRALHHVQQSLRAHTLYHARPGVSWCRRR